MTIEEFGAALGVEPPLLAPAYELFGQEARMPRKTRAARAADLADGLRHLGVPEHAVHIAVHELIKATRR